MTPLITFLALASLQAQTPDYKKLIYPLGPALGSPTISTDTTDIPAAAEWAANARALVERWYPAVTALLATEDFEPPKTLKLTFKKTLNVPSYCTSEGITINGEWIAKHPEDFGMVIHELTHSIQSYPQFDSKPGWLVEGIADYIRWWRYEPETPRPVITDKNNYDNSYRITAYWLAYVSTKYDRQLVPALDRAMRHKQDPMPLFQKITGKTPEDLWKEFVASR